MAFGRSDHGKAISGVVASRQEEEVRARATSRRLTLFESWLSLQPPGIEWDSPRKVPAYITKAPCGCGRKESAPEFELEPSKGGSLKHRNGCGRLLYVPASLYPQAEPLAKNPAVPAWEGMPRVRQTVELPTSLADKLPRRATQRGRDPMFDHGK